MKISELKSPYKELAEMRRTDKNQNILSAAFCWNISPEGFEFWRNVNHKVNSEIPTESLEELYEKGFLKWSNGKEQPKKSEEVDCTNILHPIESLVLQRIGEALNERIDELKSRIEKDKEQIKWIKSILKGKV
jgi:hypothetical protein